MANDALSQRSERGFTLLEMLVVVAIVATMAAVAVPSISNYMRHYRIRGAASDVAGELQTTRSKAIMTNTNLGVTFVTVDADSYRFIQEDLAAAEQLGPLKDLPIGIRFVDVGGVAALRFQRLGGYCVPGVPPCPGAPAPVCTGAENAPRCLREALGPFVGTEAGGASFVTLLEENTGLRRRVRIAPGGRVLIQEGQAP
jgi:prepilin-type N-terminal cleavage/methylation domain-containing protein